MDNFSLPLANTVRNKRKELGLTQVKLAERIHAEKRTIVKIEKGDGNPKLEILYPLIRELEINPLSIFYPKTDTSNSVSSQFLIFLSKCSEEEISFLLTVCEGVLTAFRSSQAALRE